MTDNNFDEDLLARAGTLSSRSQQQETVVEETKTTAEQEVVIVEETTTETTAENTQETEEAESQNDDGIDYPEWLKDEADTPVVKITETASDFTPKLKEYGIEDFTPQAVVAKIEELKNTKPVADPILEDPLVQAVINLRKENKGIEELANLAGTDASKLSAEELFNIALDKANLTDEQREVELERFSEKTFLEKRNITKQIADELNAERYEKLKQFNTNHAELEAKAKADAQIRIQTATKEIETIARGYVGKELFGMPITEAESNKLIQDAMYEPVRFKPDGSIDTQAMLHSAFLMRNYKTIVKHNVQKSRVEGKKSILNDINLPDKNQQVRATTVHSKETPADRGRSLLEEEHAQRAR